MAEVADGTIDFSGGQNASQGPDRVPEDSYFSAINTSAKTGGLSPRDGLFKKDLIYPEGGIRVNSSFFRTYKEIFLSGKYQLSVPYSIGATHYVVIVVSGIIFLLNKSTLRMEVIPIEGGSSLNESASRLNSSSAGRFLVIYDYPAYPVILYGRQATRSTAYSYGVPISVLGAFNESRLFIGNAGNEYTAGDPVGNPLTPDAPITFEEVEAPNAPYVGQVFSLPTHDINDPITAMLFLPSVDTSTGIGPLLISTKKGIWSVQSANARATWRPEDFATLFLYEAGIAGKRAYTYVQSDLFFISSDGQLRSASMARDEQRKWAKVPMSREVKNWLKFWDKDLVQFAAVSYFDNKIILTCNPYRVSALTKGGKATTDYTHGGFVVMELENISTLGQTGKPAWAGLWTGIRPMDFCVTDDRCFIFAKEDGQNAVFELMPGVTVDYADGKFRDIESVVYTRMYDCKDSFQDKELKSLDISLTNLRGDFSLETYFKPSHGASYTKWRKFKHSAPFNTCSVPTKCFNGFAPHALSRLTLGSPDDYNSCDPVSKEFNRKFRKVQLKFKIKGRDWQIRDLKLRAITGTDDPKDNSCVSYGDVPVCSECNSDWVIPRFKTC